jgi:chromosome segregation ATPase
VRNSKAYNGHTHTTCHPPVRTARRFRQVHFRASNMSVHCRESLLKLQGEHESSRKQVHAAKEHAQANAALRKEVQDLRFRLIMSGSDASTVDKSVRGQWEDLKNDLVQQVQNANATIAQLRQATAGSAASAAESSDASAAATRVGGAADALARTETALADSQAKVAELESERDKLTAQMDALRQYNSKSASKPGAALAFQAQFS